MEPIYDGWTPPVIELPTKAQLIALRDLLLSHGDKNAAAAVDNVIDILSLAAKGEFTQVIPTAEKERAVADEIIKRYGGVSDEAKQSLSEYFNAVPVIPTAEKVEVRSNPALQAGVRYEARQMAHTLTDRNPTTAEIALDNGKLRSYVVSNSRHAIADNHEFHSYTWDGE